MHSISFVALAEDLEMIAPPSCPVGSPDLPPTHASLGEKDGQRDAQPLVIAKR
jgi:hypothetical protein